MKRKTNKLIELNQITLLLALEDRLDIELNITSDILKRNSSQFSRTNSLHLIDNINKELAQAKIIIQQLTEAIQEIKENNAESIKNNEGSFFPDFDDM